VGTSVGFGVGDGVFVAGRGVGETGVALGGLSVGVSEGAAVGMTVDAACAVRSAIATVVPLVACTDGSSVEAGWAVSGAEAVDTASVAAVAGTSAVAALVVDGTVVVSTLETMAAVGVGAAFEPDSDRIMAKMMAKARMATAAMATMTSFPTSRCIRYPSGSATTSTGSAR
jgi:hypothetical protein